MVLAVDLLVVSSVQIYHDTVAVDLILDSS